MALGDKYRHRIEVLEKIGADDYTNESIENHLRQYRIQVEKNDAELEELYEAKQREKKEKNETNQLSDNNTTNSSHIGVPEWKNSKLIRYKDDVLNEKEANSGSTFGCTIL